MKITLPWWHRALRPWFDFLAARRAALESRQFHRVGYFLEVSRVLPGRPVVGVLEALQNARGQRKLNQLEGFYGQHYAIPKAWVAGDDGVAGYIHPTPFTAADQQQVAP